MNRRFFEAGDHAAAARGDFETLHRFRLLTKNYRYGLELFHPALGWRFKTEIRELRQLQEHLGSINDCVSVLQLREIDRAAATAIRRLLVIRERRFHECWKKTFSSVNCDRWLTTLGHAESPRKRLAARS
jgi:CHAD domain-containing protein